MDRKFLLPALLLLLAVSCTKVEKTTWPNGKPKTEITRKGKAYHGKATFWYETGGIQTTCFYVNDLLEGDLVSYYPSGDLQVEQTYSKGKLNGRKRVYDPDGRLAAESHYRMGVLHGKYLEYYPGTGLKVEGNYDDGHHDGTWYYYDNGGNIIGEGVFSKGNGTQRAFFTNGKIRQSTKYQNDTRHGDEIIYREDGTIEVINKFEQGKLVEKVVPDKPKK